MAGTGLHPPFLTFTMTREAVEAELQRSPATTREKAFQTIVKKRTIHGGILAEGARFIKQGENGREIGSRWYAKTLAQRIINLQQVADRIDFRCDNGLRVMQEFADHDDVIYFIDPPYTAGGKRAGKRLYKHHQLDHEYLFTICASIAGNFLMTYDDSEEVKTLAHKHGLQMRLVLMKNTHQATMK
ncbi:DNA adenine methylase [Chloroflexus sp.]|uniref:DNA adenine methylase n=1 Tax=Chloroflexus sp. TaxID=1904827 RepID=UPI00261A8E2D|nr:DNA adenine methylase [uncultured Chloroflexus sp.]